MRHLLLLFFIFCTFACTSKIVKNKTNNSLESSELAENTNHPNERMRYKLIQSRYQDNASVWASVEDDLEGFTKEQYNSLKPLILNKDINSLQASIAQEKLSYADLTRWYLYRIILYESNPRTSLNAIIALNKDALEQAKICDTERKNGQHPIYGMPILLKDNIGTEGMATTAGAIALAKNYAPDATIVKNMKAKGAIILGKVNLSEWAYYFCDGCPFGYSAIGGQSLNPYGRRKFETGGSSAGSGTSMAANYAAAAIGTETSGSILSPASQNSIVGLKPSIGLVSRTGIVPISSTLDTPGPMTRSVVDNAIVLSAMVGKDPKDPITRRAPQEIDYLSALGSNPLNKLTLGANTSYYEVLPLYKQTMLELKEQGVTIVEFSPEEVDLEGFVSILDYDMQRDMPIYLQTQAPRSVEVRSLQDIISFNKENMELRAPYGQSLLEKSSNDTTSDSDMAELKKKLEKNTRAYYDKLFNEYKLDAILSINNYDAVYAAVAKYPCLALPMGYTDEGEPKALTLVGQRFEEQKLLQIGYSITESMPIRKSPKNFD